MATGYTAKLVDSGQTFEEFVLTCARAFGACIEMRDEPLSKPIPEKFVPDTYHVKALATAEKEFVQLTDMTAAQRLAFGRKRRADTISSSKRALKVLQEENARIDDMAELVKEWKPPTKDHSELKSFMLQQLETSRRSSSFSENSLRRAESRPELDYYTSALDNARRDITYHKEHMQDAKDRAEDRTEWVNQLRQSLKENQSCPISTK